MFFVCDSFDLWYLFIISLVIVVGIINVRIVFLEGLFFLDKKDILKININMKFYYSGFLKFDCVVKMVFYYMIVIRKIL